MHDAREVVDLLFVLRCFSTGSGHITSLYGIANSPHGVVFVWGGSFLDFLVLRSMLLGCWLLGYETPHSQKSLWI